MLQAKIYQDCVSYSYSALLISMTSLCVRYQHRLLDLKQHRYILMCRYTSHMQGGLHFKVQMLFPNTVTSHRSLSGGTFQAAQQRKR